MAEDNVIKLPVSVGTDNAAEAERQRKLFEWAHEVLRQVGIINELRRARTLDELRAVAFDAEDTEVILAIRSALCPANRKREECFRGLNDRSLKRLLKNKFADLKKERAKALRRSKQHDWSDDLTLSKDGTKVLSNLHNVSLILRHHPEWQHVLAYNEHTGLVEIKKRPPWGKSNPQWSDDCESRMRIWFQASPRLMSPTMGDVGRGVEAAARHNPFHPVRQHLESLTWDGVPRLDAWLSAYLSAADTLYTRSVGMRWLVSGVARTFRPGCQADHTLLLEGAQGVGKSAALRLLAIRDEWFSDRLSHLSSKDAAMETAGVLLIELAELDAFLRVSSSTAKAFLTRTKDRLRRPYGKHLTYHPRQCIFGASLNPPRLGYLKDETGSRRFWPVACGCIDLAGLERDRDQLWAEAVRRFRDGQPWHLETKELEGLATAEQAKRFAIDAWGTADHRVAWQAERGQRRSGTGRARTIAGASKPEPRRENLDTHRVHQASAAARGEAARTLPPDRSHCADRP